MSTTINNLNYRVLSAAVQKMPTPSTFFTDLFYGNRIARDADDIDIDIISGNKKLAPFVTQYDPASTVAKLTSQQSSVKAPKIRLKKQLPAAWFNEREAGTTVYLNPQEKETAKLTKIKREMQDLKNMIVRRTEWMCAQSLKGSISYTRDHVKFSVDFGLPETHTPTLETTALWSAESTSNPLTDLDTYVELINQDSGTNATDVVFGANAAKDFKKHPAVLEAYNKKNILIGTLEKKGSNYLGNYNGLDLWQNFEKYTDDSDVSQYMIDPNACAVVAKNTDFELNFGAVEDLDAGGNVMADFYSKMWKEPDPSAMWLLVESHPLPLPKRIESIVYAVVTARAA